MEKNTRTKNILLVVLLIAVLTLSISYAALQQTLTINSEAVIGGKNENWNIRFTAASCSGTGYGTVEHGFNATNTTSLSGLVAKLRTPGDSVVCQLTVENLGTINADLNSFTLQQGNLTYTGTTGDSKTSDEAAANGKVLVTLKYATGDADAGKTPHTKNSAQASDDTNDVIQAPKQGETRVTSRNMTLTFTLDPTLTADTMPENDVTISGYNVVFLYQQI